MRVGIMMGVQMMNCLNVRRILLADPEAHAAALPEHLAGCPSCRAFAAGLAAHEAALRLAINVPVPEHLQERILLQTQLRARRRDWAGAWRNWLQVLSFPRRAVFAAGCSMALLLAVWTGQPADQRSIDWSDVALAHVIGEGSGQARAGTVPRQELVAALAAYGLALNGELGAIRMVDHCPMPGGRGVHVVIDTPDLGTLTLILPPLGVRTVGGMARSEGHAAQVVRIAKSSIGVVTERPEKLQALAARLQQRVVALG